MIKIAVLFAVLTLAAAQISYTCISGAPDANDNATTAACTSAADNATECYK